MAMSRRSRSLNRRMARPWASASSSVAGEVATQVMSSRRLPRAGTSSATVVPVPRPTAIPSVTSAAAASAATRFSAGTSGVTTAAPSTARHVLPGELLVRAHVAGKAQDPLTQDVPHHLGGPALDGIRPHPEEHLARVRGAHPDEL